MAEMEQKVQPKPSIWDTLASAQGAPSLNNDAWEQTDGWGQSLNTDGQWKSDKWGMPSGKKEHVPSSWTRSSRSPGCVRTRNVRSSFGSTGGDLRQHTSRNASRRSGWGSRDQSLSQVPKWRRTGRDLDRLRGRVCTSSLGRCQNIVGRRVMDEAFSHDQQISSQNHGDPMPRKPRNEARNSSKDKVIH